MIWQDANQVNEWWCYGKLPPPTYIATTGRGGWLCWQWAAIHA